MEEPEPSEMGHPQVQMQNEASQLLGFLWQYLHQPSSAACISVDVDWLPLRGLLDRLEDALLADPDRWLRWAEGIAAGQLQVATGVQHDPSAKDGEYVADAAGDHAPGQATSAGPLEGATLGLLESLPRGLLGQLVPQALHGGATPQLASVLALLQLLLLVVLLCHSLTALLAGAEAFVSAHIEEGAARFPSKGLQAVLGSTTHVQPVVTLCYTAASGAYDAIYALAEQDGGRKIVHLTLTGVSASNLGLSMPNGMVVAGTTASTVLELVEESKDVGRWVVLHLSPGDSSNTPDGCPDPFELLERCWLLCGGLREDSVHDSFRLFLVVDLRSARYIPQWIFDGRTVSFCADLAGAPLRLWFERFISRMRPMLVEPVERPKEQELDVARPNIGDGAVADLRRQPSGVANRRRAQVNRRLLPASVVADTTLAREAKHLRQAKPHRTADTTTMVTSVQTEFKNVGLGCTALRVMVQLALSALAAASPCIVGSSQFPALAPVLGLAEGQVADDFIHQLVTRVTDAVGPEAVYGLRLDDVFEMVALLVLGHEAGSAQTRQALSELLQNLQNTWFQMRKDRAGRFISDADPVLLGSEPDRPGSRAAGDDTDHGDAEGREETEGHAIVVAARRSTVMLRLIEALERHWQDVLAEGQDQHNKGDNISKAVVHALHVLPLHEIEGFLHCPGGDRAAFHLALPFFEKRQDDLVLPACSEVSPATARVGG